MSAPVYLSNREVKVGLEAVFPEARINVWDRRYCAVSRLHVLEGFSEEFRSELRSAGIHYWAPQFDCEDWSLHAMSLAKRKHHLAHIQKKVKVEGILCGLICYHQGGDTSKGHAVNIFGTERGFEVYEPQRFAFTELSEVERESCWCVVI